MQCPAGDVDVGDLTGDRLERGQRSAELLAARDVLRGQVESSGDGPVGHRGRPGEGEQVQVVNSRRPALAVPGLRPSGAGRYGSAVSPENSGDRGGVQPDRVLRRSA